MSFAQPLVETNIIPTFYENNSRGKDIKEGTYYSRLKLVTLALSRHCCIMGIVFNQTETNIEQNVLNILRM